MGNAGDRHRCYPGNGRECEVSGSANKQQRGFAGHFEIVAADMAGVVTGKRRPFAGPHGSGVFLPDLTTAKVLPPCRGGQWVARGGEG
jgi:hypothetical protein